MSNKQLAYHALYDEEYYKEYDSTILQILPFYPKMHQDMIGLIRKEPNENISILDVGSGTGTISAQILDKFPNAEVVGVDDGEINAKKAITRLNGRNFTSLVGDLRRTGLDRKYNYVISALTLHHISEADKRKYFKKIHEILKKGGRFIIGDIVKSNEEEKWHQYLVDTLGNEGEKSWQLHKNNKYDQPSTLESQLKWLKDAGFAKVDLVDEWFNFKVFYGEK